MDPLAALAQVGSSLGEGEQVRYTLLALPAEATVYRAGRQLVSRALLLPQGELEAMRRLIWYDHFNVPMQMAELHEMIREFLFARMQGKEESQSLERVKARYFKRSVRIERPVDVGWRPETLHHQRLENLPIVFRCALLVLGTLLAQAPIMTPSSE